MHLVLTLHSHLPYVLNHGRWPHGSDWLCEASLDTYLPLLATLLELEEEGIPAPVSLGITPVLANQLASPSFVEEMEAFFAHRLEACAGAPSSLESTGDQHLLPLIEFWRMRFLDLRELFWRMDGNLVQAFRRLEETGRLEILSSAATHGFLPLLGREESIRLQLAVGVQEHQRLFGCTPRGCWVPECAYRPAGLWDPIPGVSRRSYRSGLETHLSEAGFRYFFVDTHMAQAGESLGAYGDVTHGVERFDAEWTGRTHLHSTAPVRSPFQAFRVSGDRDSAPGVAVFVREPRSSMQVWSRHHGYPGDEWYLEFHKIRWPEGLKFWRVTGPTADLGEKLPYSPRVAAERSREHASHFSRLLGQLRREEAVRPGSVAMAPFDTELFGHWWFEGVGFLGHVYRRLFSLEGVLPVTGSEYLAAFPPSEPIRPLEGSWGAGGNFSMWLNQDTAWTWKRLWALEERFWDQVPQVLGQPSLTPILAQAARQLLLAQASDWQFMISTGAVPDYAEERFKLHCDDLEGLLAALTPGASETVVEGAFQASRALETRDGLFPGVAKALQRVLAGS